MPVVVDEAGVSGFLATSEPLAASSAFKVSQISQRRGSLFVMEMRRELSKVQALHDHWTVRFVSTRTLLVVAFAFPPATAPNIASISFLGVFFLGWDGVAVPAVDDEATFRADDEVILSFGQELFLAPPPAKKL